MKRSFLRLASWLAMVSAVCVITSCSKAETPEETAVREHLQRYFSSWSGQDMKTYEECFLPQARITFVKPGGSTQTEGLTDFLFSQRMSHQMAKSPMKETPKNFKITTGKGIAQAAVTWELQKADGNSTGTDFFTLARTESGWRIAALVWEQD